MPHFLLPTIPCVRAAPLQAIFRGFLLASLARYMAPHWAVVATSLLFAMCHFRLQVGPRNCFTIGPF
jgi:hypothetical protein